MKYLRTLLIVENIKNTREFYENVLAQKVLYDFHVNVIYQSGFGIIDSSHYHTLVNQQATVHDGRNCILYFEDDKLEVLVAKLKQVHVEFIHGIQEQPWRQKVVRFFDNEKNIIECGESIEGLVIRLHQEGNDKKTISEITGLHDEKLDSILIDKNPSFSLE